MGHPAPRRDPRLRGPGDAPARGPRPVLGDRAPAHVPCRRPALPAASRARGRDARVLASVGAALAVDGDARSGRRQRLRPLRAVARRRGRPRRRAGLDLRGRACGCSPARRSGRRSRRRSCSSSRTAAREHGPVRRRPLSPRSLRGREASRLPAARLPGGVELPDRASSPTRINLALQALLFFYIGRHRGSHRPSQLRWRAGHLLRVRRWSASRSRWWSASASSGQPRAFRNEQLMGTLEVLLMTPTTPATIQIGSVVYDLVYVPLRTGLFFLAVVARRGRRDQHRRNPAGCRDAGVLHPLRVGAGHPLRGVDGHVQGGRRRLRRLHPHDHLRGLFPAVGVPRLAGDAGRAEPDDAGDGRDARVAAGRRRMVGCRAPPCWSSHRPRW